MHEAACFAQPVGHTLGYISFHIISQPSRNLKCPSYLIHSPFGWLRVLSHCVLSVRTSAACSPACCHACDSSEGHPCTVLWCRGTACESTAHARTCPQSVSMPEASPSRTAAPVMLYTEDASTAWLSARPPRWPAKAKLTKDDRKTRAACELIGPAKLPTLCISQEPRFVCLLRDTSCDPVSLIAQHEPYTGVL